MAGRHVDTLATRGIRLDTAAGEYQVNFCYCYGAEATAYFTEDDLHNALDGHRTADARDQVLPEAPKKPGHKRRNRRTPMTAAARHRRRIRAHRFARLGMSGNA